MAEKIKVVYPTGESTNIARLIDDLKDRAKKHRASAKIYTLGIFITILGGLVSYTYFNVLKLSQLEGENIDVANTYKVTDSLITKSIKEIKGRLNVEAKGYNETIEKLISIRSNLQNAHSNLLAQSSSYRDIETINEDNYKILPNIFRKNDELVRIKFKNLENQYFRNEIAMQDESFSDHHNLRSTQFNLRQLSYRIAGDTSRATSRGIRQYYQMPLYKSIKPFLRDLKKGVDSLTKSLNENSQNYKSVLLSDTIILRNSKRYLVAWKEELDKAKLEEQNSSEKLFANLDKIQSKISSIDATRRKIGNLTTMKFGLPTDLNSASQLIKELTAIIEDYKEQLITIEESQNALSTKIASSVKKSDKLYSIPELIIRYGLVIFLIYIIQILLSYNKYHFRLASFYDSKADALNIRRDLSDIKTEDIIRLLDASSVSFGRTENIYQKAIELSKDILSNLKPNK